MKSAERAKERIEADVKHCAVEKLREAVNANDLDEKDYPLLEVTNDHDSLVALVSDCMKDARLGVGDVAKCSVEYWVDRIRILAEAPAEEIGNIGVVEQREVVHYWQSLPGHCGAFFMRRLGDALQVASADQAAKLKAAFPDEWKKAKEGHDE